MLPPFMSRFVVAVLLTGVITGCAKNEQPIEQLKNIQIDLKARTIDPFRLRVTTDEALLANALVAPGDLSIPFMQYATPAQHMQVTDLYSNKLLLDTIIGFRSGHYYTLTLFQQQAGGKLVWLGPPVNEPMPPSGFMKTSIIYSYPALPDEVKVVVFNSKSGGSPADYIPTDSFQLQKGAFSPWFTGGLNRKPKLAFYRTDGDQRQVATVSDGPFSPANIDFSIFSFNKASSTSGGVYDLGSDKLY